MSKIIVR